MEVLSKNLNEILIELVSHVNLSFPERAILILAGENLIVQYIPCLLSFERVTVQTMPAQI